MQPGTTRVALEPGVFCIQTLADAQLRVVEGGVTPQAHTNREKGTWPPPPGTGDDADGEQPTLTAE